MPNCTSNSLFGQGVILIPCSDMDQSSLPNLIAPRVAIQKMFSRVLGNVINGLVAPSWGINNLLQQLHFSSSTRKVEILTLSERIGSGDSSSYMDSRYDNISAS